MINNKFQFEPISRVENYQFPDSLNDFFSRGVTGTIRENIQNSLDAKLGYSDKPVSVTITFDTIQKKEIPGIEEVFKHINSLEGGTDYSARTIKYLQDQEVKETVQIMTIEDRNTKGLNGADIPLSDSGTASSTYNAYAYQRGIHPKSDNEQFEKKRGGSHGVGKIANNAASDIYLMYFANCDEEGNQNIGGNVQLVEHNLDGQAYRSTGYFADLQNQTLSAFKNKHLNSNFQKNSRGLKNIIPYIRKEFTNPKDIVTAVCDNFFLAILENDLVVNLENRNEGRSIKINKETILDIIKDDTYYVSEISEMKKNFTPLYIQTYLEKEAMPIQIHSKRDTYDFKLYFDYNLEIPVGRVGILRTIGMKIDDFGVTSMKRKPYNAVLIGGPKEDDYLKTLENESHTAISADDFVDREDYLDAIRFIRNLEKKIREIITDKMEEINPSSGTVNTDDILYQTQQAFKKDLEKMSNLVQISDGKAIRKKKKVEMEKRSERNNRGSKHSDPKRTQVRKPRKLQPGETVNSDAEDLYVLSSDDVHRIIGKNAEHVSLNLSNYNENKRSKCDISIRIVNGQGKEIENRFNVNENYQEVIDLNNQNLVELSPTSINNLSIVEDKVQFKISFYESYNKNLKFIYKVVMSE